MNRLLFILSFAVTLLQIPLLADTAKLSDGSSGEVTLNWQKFQEMWDSMQSMTKRIHDLEKPEILPPVPYTMTKAAYRGYVGEKKTRVEAVFEMDVYDPKNWVKVPFLPSGLAITEATMDGAPAGVLQENGYHHILLKKPGRHVLHVQFAVRSPKPEEAPQINFPINQTPMTLVAFEFPKSKLDVAIEPAEGVEISETENHHTLVTAALPPTSNVSIHWQKALPEENAGPAKVYVDSQNLITVSEGTLRSTWLLNYSILRRGVRELRLQVPEAWNILSVNAEGMQEWKMLDTAHGPVLAVQFAYAKKGNVGVSLQMERAFGDKEEVFDLPRLRAIDIEREQGTVGIEAKGAVELAVQSNQGLQPMDPKELPSGIWQSASQPILFAFRYTKPFTLAMDVQRHPETPVLTTTIDAANAVSVLTSRGQLITKIRYQVRNQLKQYLSLRLPKDAALWSAFVSGQPVKPMLAQDGSFRIPLAKSQMDAQGQQGFPVEIIYYRTQPKFLPMGARAMKLPMPDAPVSRMAWSLYMPEKYRFPYFGGDMEKGAQASAWNAITGSAYMDREELGEKVGNKKENRRLAKDMKSLLGRLSKAKAANMGEADEIMAQKQQEVASSLFQANTDVPMSPGIFPVAFELPATGQLFNFGQIMVVGQDPELTFVFFHERILHTLIILILLGIAVAMYRQRQWLLIQGRAMAQWLKIPRRLQPAAEQ